MYSRGNSKEFCHQKEIFGLIKDMKLLEAFVNMDLLADLERIEKSLEIDPDDRKVLADLQKVAKETGIPMKNQRDVQKVLYFFKNQEQAY